MTVKFTFAGFMNVRGIVRLLPGRGFPDLKLYVSPIQIDPRAPVGPISSPPDYAADLAERIGLFHTIGMPEETWALNEGQMTDDGWLDMEADDPPRARGHVLRHAGREDSELVVQVFVQTDRTSHMFWRGIDAAPAACRDQRGGAGAIRWIYGEADRILGKIHRGHEPGDRLIVLSDHGFAPWRAASTSTAGWSTTASWRPSPARPARTAVRQRQLDQDPGLRHRPQRHLPQPSAAAKRWASSATTMSAALKQEIIAKLQSGRDPATGEPFMLTVYDGRRDLRRRR